MPGYKHIAAALLLALAAPLAAADLNLSDPAAVARLTADLAGPDSAARDAAQQKLQQIPRAAKEQLRRIADATDNPQARARLIDRVDELQLLDSIDPPPIKFDVDGADLEALGVALSRSTGTRIALGGYGTGWKLKTDAMPFWEVYQRLAEQLPLPMAGGFKGRGMSGVPPKWDFMQIHHGFAVFLKLPPPVAAGAGRKPELNATIELGIDPRIDLLETGYPVKIAAVDDRGQHWKPTLGSLPGALNRQAMFSTRPLLLESPDAPAKSMTISGVWPVQVHQDRVTTEIADLNRPPAKPLDFGRHTITVRQISLTPNPTGTAKLKMDLLITRRDAPPATAPDAKAPANPPRELPPLSYWILDAAGNEVFTGTINGSTENVTLGSVPGNSARMILSYSARSSTYKIPFEFKDVPLPK